jgi:putative oxidoreductase
MGVLLAGRLLLVLLFLISGWIKLSGFDDTITLMVKFGMPAPAVMAVVAILFELPVALAILLGFATRPLALIFAGYAVMAALIVIGQCRGLSSWITCSISTRT